MIKLKINSRQGAVNVMVVALLILVILAAVGVLWSIINKITNSSQLSPAFSCAEWQFEPPLKIAKACYSSDKREIAITISRDNKIYSLDSLNFIAQLKNEKAQWQCGEGCGLCTILKTDSVKTYYFNLDDNEQPESIELSTNGCVFGKKTIAVCE